MAIQSESHDFQTDIAAAPTGSLLLTRHEVAGLLGLDECIGAVETAFRALASDDAIPPAVLGVHVDGGGFHIKTAGLAGSVPYFAAKLNGNFYGNAERFALPRIQGLIVLSDARNGYPLAIMDSTEITAIRTAATTAVAAKYLSRADSTVATICGCGLQGRVHLAALNKMRPLEIAYAYDADIAVAESFVADLSSELGIELRPTAELALSARRSDIIVTCTPSEIPLLGPDDVAPGSFVAAVGADSEEKQELDAGLLVTATVVVDNLEQCATIGELHHALEQDLIARSDVYAELHEVVAERRPGRTSDTQVIIFDSTGIAIEDVAAAALVYERARRTGVGTWMELL